MELHQDRLVLLEKLLAEFYSDNTNNQRKKEIETVLNNLENQSELWKECCHYMENTNNIYIHMYCLHVLENVIVKKWTHIMVEDKKILTNKLKQYIILKNFPYLIHHKIIKLIVDIARSDWPHNYPEFFNEIINFFQDSNTIDLGLLFIQVCCDELLTPPEVICASRKDDLKQLIRQYIPQIFSILKNVLVNLNNLNTVDNTLASRTLTCFCNLFSWVPISSVYTIELLFSIFPFLYNDHRIPALSALNEILYQNCVPSSESVLICAIGQQISNLLLLSTEMNLNVLINDSSYITKLLESVRLIFSTHWHRIEQNIDTLSNLMSSFVHFTSVLPITEPYYDCLQIWCLFLDYVKLHEMDSRISEYEERVILPLAELVIKRFQSRADLYVTHFSSTISKDDDDDDDDDDEYYVFLKRHTKLLGQLVEVFPRYICVGVVSAWKESASVYLKLLMNRNTLINLSAKEKFELHKFTTNTQLLAVVCSYLESHVSRDILTDAIRMATLANKLQIDQVSGVSSEVTSYLIHANHELLVGLRMWLPSRMSENENEILFDLLMSCYPFIVNTKKVENKILISANVYMIGQLMKTNFNKAQYFQPLMQDPSFSHLPKDSRLVLHCAIFSWVLNCKDESEEKKTQFLIKLMQFASVDETDHFKVVAVLIKHSNPKKAEYKALLFKLIESGLELVINTFDETLTNNPTWCVSMMTFFVECFVILKEYMRYQTQRVLQIFLHYLASPNNIEEITDGFETLMKVLTTVLEKGENITDLIPYIVDVSIQHLRKEYTGQHLTQDVKFGVYRLLSCIVTYNWKYFLNEDLPVAAANGVGSRIIKLDLILNVFSDFVNQPNIDINSIVYVIECLETINEKWKLYYRDFFRKKYLPNFQTILLTCLITKSYDLLSENMIKILYHMVSVDFTYFYCDYMVNFITQLPGLKDEQRILLRNTLKEETDSPSFQLNISRFLNDVRYYRMINNAQ